MTTFVMGVRGTALAVRALAATVPGSVLAVDLSAPAGGLDIVFGVEHQQGWRWEDIVAAEGDIDLDLLLDRLPGVAPHIRVLSHGRRPTAVPATLQASVVAAARAHPVHDVVEVQDPLVVRELSRPGDRIILTGELDPRTLGAMVAALRVLPPPLPVSVLAYAAHGEAALRVDETIDADVDFVRRDRRAERAMARGLDGPCRGPMARWARSWLARGGEAA